MSKIDYNELVEFIKAHDEYYVAEIMFGNQQRIAELEKELAELKEKAIVPKFKYQDYVYVLYADTEIFKGQIDMFDYYTNRYFIFFGEDIGSDWFSENLLFTTKREAQAKLKEIKGNE